jgi:hypothetical protein
MRDWRVTLGLCGVFVALTVIVRAATAHGEPAGGVDSEQEIRALIKDVRGYLRRLDRTSPRETAEARREIANGARDLAAERVAMRKAGLPLTRVELKEPVPPPEQDAAPIYRQLVRVLKAQPLDEGAAAGSVQWTAVAVSPCGRWLPCRERGKGASVVSGSGGDGGADCFWIPRAGGPGASRPLRPDQQPTR